MGADQRSRVRNGKKGGRADGGREGRAAGVLFKAKAACTDDALLGLLNTPRMVEHLSWFAEKLAGLFPSWRRMRKVADANRAKESQPGSYAAHRRSIGRKRLDPDTEAMLRGLSRDKTANRRGRHDPR